MASSTWDTIVMPPGPADSGQLWETFHENSKTSRYDQAPSSQEIVAHMAEMWEAFPYDAYPTIELPATRQPLALALDEAIASRVSARTLNPLPLSLDAVATLLHYAYGLTRDNKDTVYPRPFRTIPSGGALYPLELYFHSTMIEGLRAGIYHYDPTRNVISLLRDGDFSRQIADALIQKEAALNSSLMLFITAMFERSTFKYGDRGYRFVLLEAGHLAQNTNLVANALGLGSLNIGGFMDRMFDDLLGLDGLMHSTIYAVAFGENADRSRGTAELV